MCQPYLTLSKDWLLFPMPELIWLVQTPLNCWCSFSSNHCHHRLLKPTSSALVYCSTVFGFCMPISFLALLQPAEVIVHGNIFDPPPNSSWSYRITSSAPMANGLSVWLVRRSGIPCRTTCVTRLLGFGSAIPGVRHSGGLRYTYVTEEKNI